MQINERSSILLDLAVVKSTMTPSQFSHIANYGEEEFPSSSKKNVV